MKTKIKLIYSAFAVVILAIGGTDVAAQTWTATGSLSLGRQEHTATLLPSGRVLVVGGYNGSYLSSAELYDPATGSWSNTGSLATAREFHTATLLPSGKVLVAGGGGGGLLSSAELYDPATGSWSSTASLGTARSRHTATLLPSGKVLVAGGAGGGFLSSAELYDSAVPNSPPVAIDDFYGLDQATSLSVASPGVLANDSDPDNDPLAAELVTGPAQATSFQLNPDGSFAYMPAPYFYGEDTFTYRANDGTDYSEIATVHITVSPPGSAGFITGGGNFFQDDRKCTFGFVAKVQGNGVQGNLEFQDHDASMDVSSQLMQVVYAANSIDGYFSGTCTVNGAAGYTFFVQIHDRGEPGSNDDVTIWIFDSLNNTVYSAGALLSGGNIVIH